MKVLMLIAAALPFISCQVGQEVPYKTDIHDPFVIFAVAGINNLFQSNGDVRARVAEQVIYATSQVVAGTTYRFEIEVSGGDSEEVCNVTVWSQPWLQEDKQTKIVGTPICVAKTPARRQVGQPEVVHLSDEGVLEALKFLEKNITALLKSANYLVGIDFNGITKQVVNGVIYKFTNVSYAESTCSASEVLDSNYNKCVGSAIGALVVSICTSEVYWNPRETPEYKVTSNLCRSHA